MPQPGCIKKEKNNVEWPSARYDEVRRLRKLSRKNEGKSNAIYFDNMRVLSAESKMCEDAKHLFSEAHWDCLCQEAPKPAEAIMLGAKWSTVHTRISDRLHVRIDRVDSRNNSSSPQPSIVFKRGNLQIVIVMIHVHTHCHCHCILSSITYSLAN